MNESQTPIRAAIYVRANHHAPPPDLQPCEDYARAQGFVVMQVFADHAGGHTLERSGLSALRAAARAGMVDVLVVLRLDRLSRNVADLARLQEELVAAGVALRVVEGVAGGARANRLFTVLLPLFEQVAWEQRRVRATRKRR